MQATEVDSQIIIEMVHSIIYEFYAGIEMIYIVSAGIEIEGWASWERKCETER